jgi:hypothetical protein
MNDDSLDQLAQRCDELALVEFRSLCRDLGQAPDVGFGLVDLELAWFACDRPIEP